LVAIEDMNLVDRVHANPPNWKDWVGGFGMMLSLIVMFVQGGRILESLDNTRAELKTVVGAVTMLKDDMASNRTELARQQGTDALHEEKIRNLDVRLVRVERVK
jgi:hypothetical protein